MNNLTMGFENILAANGIILSLVGILIVFAALSIIALSIALLPKILPLIATIFPEEDHAHGTAHSASVKSDHDEVLAAIAYALFHKQASSLPVE